jgi:Mor family transcriptional regulator
MANKPKLPLKQRDKFKDDMKTLSITELARKYKLSEKVAYNWREKLK